MRIDRLTIAATDMVAMVRFYDSTFDTGFERIEGTDFHLGQLAGLQILLCPNEIAQVEAEKNRIQLRLVVDDVDGLVRRAGDAGGTPFGERVESDGVVGWGVADPDGNSIELTSGS
jgi:predicted enzyme related to lactoylglutathione lyase